MDTQNQKKSTFISRHEVNYYVVYTPLTKSIIYVGTQEECQRYVIQSEIENSQIWHIHDVDIHSKPVYIMNQE